MQTLELTQLTPDQRDRLIQMLANSETAKIVLAQHHTDNRAKRQAIIAGIEPAIAAATKELAPRVKALIKLQAEHDDLTAKLRAVTSELNPIACSVSHASQTLDSLRGMAERDLSELADPRITHAKVYVGQCINAVQGHVQFHMVTERGGWLGESHRIEQSNFTEVNAIVKKLDSVRDRLSAMQVGDYDPATLLATLTAAIDEAHRLMVSSGCQVRMERMKLSDF